MNIYSYREHQIKPKLDFGTQGFLIDGKWIKKGWVAVKDGCNVMPGACWFQTLRKAKHGIDVLIRVRGDATRFWEIMQPFKYRVGQRVETENGCIQKGRFLAVIKNHRVVSIDRHAQDIYA